MFDYNLFHKDFSALAPRATGTGAQLMQDADGRDIVSAYTTIDRLGWRIFGEVSMAEAMPSLPAEAP